MTIIEDKNLLNESLQMMYYICQ